MHRDDYSADETVNICHALCSTKYIIRVVQFGACSESYMILYKLFSEKCKMLYNTWQFKKQACLHTLYTKAKHYHYLPIMLLVLRVQPKQH